ncbi:FAD-dependent oxidoreductase [Sphaerisporangium sp. NPDC051011]|uniref:FAD-dependent oxidoreductase n=1 Tax=Sphaerisporangium sp. NPDC051011 TaxID=3155792 RepID=UPI0034002090
MADVVVVGAGVVGAACAYHAARPRCLDGAWPAFEASRRPASPGRDRVRDHGGRPPGAPGEEAQHSGQSRYVRHSDRPNGHSGGEDPR